MMTPITGTLLIIVAHVFLALTQSLVKWIGTDVSLWVIMSFRFVTAPVLLLPYFLVFRSKKLTINNWPMMIVRTVCGVCGMAFYLTSLFLIPIGEATLIFNLSTLWTFLFATFIYKDPPSIQTRVSLPLAFIGLILILMPNGLSFFEWGDLFALVGSLFLAGMVLSLKKLRENNDVNTIVFYNYFLSSLIVIVPGIKTFHIPDGSYWVALIIMGVSGFIGQLLMTLGYRFVSASIAGTASLVVVPFMYISGILFFDQYPSLLSLIGAVVMFLSLAIITKYQ